MDASLDPSWLITLNYVDIKGLVWGKDFCFTYGPLAYLPMRNIWGKGVIPFLVYDLFYFLNIFLIFFLSFYKAKNKIISFLLIAVSVVMVPVYLGGESALVWFLILLFWFNLSLTDYNRLYLIPQVLITAGLFFLKFNTGLIALFIFFLVLLYQLLFKKDRLYIALSGVLLLVIIYISAVLLNVELWGYMLSGSHIVSGYNEIMSLLTPDAAELLPAMYAVIIASVLFAGIRLLISKRVWAGKELLLKNLLTGFMFCCACFIMYKQASVRADISHIIYFFVFFNFLMLCFFGLFNSLRLKNVLNIVVLALMAIPLYAVTNNRQVVDVYNFDDKLSKKYYITKLREFTPGAGLQLYPNDNQLPEDIKNTIGNSTVDVYPWNAYMLLENKLNYMPRPVMQSYAAYTPHLEDLNYNYYNSGRAPQYVLYTYKSIDNRYALFDEPKLNLILLKNYKTVSSFNHLGSDMLLLQKREEAKPVKLEFLKEYKRPHSVDFHPEENIYYEITLDNNTEGKIKSIFEHAPEVTLYVKETDDIMLAHRTSLPLVQSGLFSDKIAANTADFKNLMSNDSIAKVRTAKSYNVTPNDKSYFKDMLHIKEYKIIH